MDGPGPYEPPPNVILRGGSLDGQTIHLGRGEEPAAYRAGDGEEYRATSTWERELRVYRLVRTTTRR